MTTIKSICLLLHKPNSAAERKEPHLFTETVTVCCLRCTVLSVYQCRPDFTTNMQTENSAIVKKTYHRPTSSWGTAWRLRQVDANR